MLFELLQHVVIGAKVNATFGDGKDDALDLLQQNLGADLEFYPVSKDMRRVKSKEPRLIDPSAV